MTRTRTAVARAVSGVVSGALAIAMTLTMSASAGAGPRPDIDVIAHRGSSGVAPENTIEAVEIAVGQRATIIENDVQRTADGELVIIHDTTLARTTNVEELFPDRSPWNVADFTLAEIKSLDAGSWFASQYAGAQVPTLTEWLDAVGRAGMLIEVKSPELYPGIEHDLLAELEANRNARAALAAGRLVVQSFNHDWLRALDALAPDLPIGLLFAGGPPTEAQLADAATWAEQANPALGDMTEATVDLIHSYGLVTNVWTVNDGIGMLRAIDWGVDGIITNYPQVLQGILRDQ